MAQRSLPLVSQWLSRFFSVELDGVPSYFALREQNRGEPVPHAFGRLQTHSRCYSLLVCAHDRIQRARLHGQLRDRLLRDLPAACHLSPMFSFLPRVRGSLVRGYFVRDHSACWSSAEKVLGDLLRTEEVVVCSYRGGEGHPLIQQVWGPSTTAAHQYCVVPSEEPENHPAADDMLNNDIFYSFEEAHSVIKQCADLIPEARALLEQLDLTRPHPHKTDFPVVVIEGLDATGKSTLTQTLRDRLGATLLCSPPQCLSPWRARFDQEPPLIRRAFYALGNYVTAAQMCRAAEEGPVIVDRFWHSTAAYAMATAVNGPVSNLPPEGSELYLWPRDLLQPSLVVLLSLDPEERKRRLRDRGEGKTEEEQELDQNRLFRLRVEEAYKRISGPTCVTVDAGPSPEQVLQQVLLLIGAKCSFSSPPAAEVPPHTTRGQ